VTEELRKELGLYLGLKGVHSSQALGGLPADVVIDSVAEQMTPTREAFLKQLGAHSRERSVWVGFWQRNRRDQWERDDRRLTLDQQVRVLMATGAATGAPAAEQAGPGMPACLDPERWVWIPPGTFIMGSPESEPNRDSDEGPQTTVTISRGFWLGKYERITPPA